MHESLKQIINSIIPYDDTERRHKAEVLNWLNTNASVYRIQKPNIPDKHLVSYFVLYDNSSNKVLLVDHVNAKLWLPTGGHVEIAEDPKDTAKRECYEELGIKAEFLLQQPVFLTSAMTVGLTSGHTDITLWYLLKGDEAMDLVCDHREFNDARWFETNDIPYNLSDPNMRRFIGKLRNYFF